MSDNDTLETRDVTGSPERIIPRSPSPPPRDREESQRTSTPAPSMETSSASAPPPPPSMAERQRARLLPILVADYLFQEEDEECAEEMAKMMLDHFVARKKLHTEAMGLLITKTSSAIFRVKKATEATEDLEAALLELHNDSTDVSVLHRTRRCLEHARGLLRDWDVVENDLKEAAKETAAIFYWPRMDQEPGTAKVNEVRGIYEETLARLNSAEQELDDLLAPPVAPPAPAAETTSSEKKIFARDFAVDKYVVDKFSGDDQTSAIQEFHTWRKEWAHAEVKVMETCKEADPEALLHLLRTALTGSALKLTSS